MKITIKSTNGDDVVKEISVAASSNKTVINEVMIVDHPFNVDDSDHCETPLTVYQGLKVVLDRLLFLSDKKQRSELIIYYPYYCDGGIKSKFSPLGYTNFINSNRDFYKDVANNSIFECDILITNPPYSSDHIEKLLEYVLS